MGCWRTILFRRRSGAYTADDEGRGPSLRRVSVPSQAFVPAFPAPVSCAFTALILPVNWKLSSGWVAAGRAGFQPAFLLPR